MDDATTIGAAAAADHRAVAAVEEAVGPVEVAAAVAPAVGGAARTREMLVPQLALLCWLSKRLTAVVMC